MKKLSAVLLVLALPGCASIVSGSSQQVNLQPSTTSHGKVEAEIISKSGVQTVRLPAVVTVKRSTQDILVNVKTDDNPCLADSSAVVPSGFNAWFLGNFITGGTLGSTTDAITGAMWGYDDVTIVPVNSNNTCTAKQ